MKLRVSPTRSQLMKIRKRLIVARRGHKLMKDKLEGLVQTFMTMVADYQRLRREIDTTLPGTLRLFMLANGVSGEEAVAAALEECDTQLDVSIKAKSVMSIPYPQITLNGFELRASYSALATTTDFDVACARLRDIFPNILDLASKEEAVIRMAYEIEKTRRRVNALEYVMIPSLKAVVREISTKLSEADRSSRSRLMKVKEMLLAKK